ncbi:MAG: hypothetical protein CFE21_13580 [Bacteroidetes bacterium B1(2017)]|nr:MAG: hypothetical protein CFE21_13580 [Bacteroidetes bacterium B1(2017)]
MTNAQLNSYTQEIIASLKEYEDLERKTFALISYPTKLELLGVRNPDLKLVLKEVKVLSKEWPLQAKMDLAIGLINTGIMECVHLAFEYIGLEKKVLATFNESHLPSFMKYMDNWVCTDTFGVHVLGVAWRNNQIKTSTIHKMASHSDFWIRRLALVATIPFNMRSRGGKGNTEQTLAVCELLVADKHDMIVKALSWALRELLEHDKDSVEKFLVKHEHVIHARVKRELKNKISTGKKNPNS